MKEQSLRAPRDPYKCRFDLQTYEQKTLGQTKKTEGKDKDKNNNQEQPGQTRNKKEGELGKTTTKLWETKKTPRNIKNN